MARKKRADEAAPTIDADIAAASTNRRRKSRSAKDPEVSREPRVEVPEEVSVEPKLRRRTRRKPASSDVVEVSSGEETPPDTAAESKPARKRGGRVPKKRTPAGDIVPDGSEVCFLCGKVHKSRSPEVQPVDLRFSIGTRVISISGDFMCMECIKQLPNFLAGAIHIAFNVPKDEFCRGFMYPPFELAFLDKHKKLK